MLQCVLAAQHECNLKAFMLSKFLFPKQSKIHILAIFSITIESIPTYGTKKDENKKAYD